MEYMLYELNNLIEFIQEEYLQFNDKWRNSKYFDKINLKNTLVKDLMEDRLMLDVAFN